MDKLIRRAGKTWRYLSWVAMATLFANSLIVIVNIILRRFFNAPIYGATEIVRYLSLFTASFAIADNEWVDGNVNMLLIVDALPEKTRKWVLCAANFVTSIGFGIVDWLLIQQTIRRFFDQTATTEIGLPLWIPNAVLTLGFCTLTIVIAAKAIIWFWMAKTGNTIVFRALGRD